MIVDERSGKAEPAAPATPGGPMVQKRVTKTVIRRRAAAPPPPPAEETAPPPTEQAAPPPPAEPAGEAAPPPGGPAEEKLEAAAGAVTEESGKTEAPAEEIPAPAAQEPGPAAAAGAASRAKPEEAADSPYLAKYKRIRVVAAPPESEAAPRGVVRPAPKPGPGAPAPGSILASPGSIGLGRKEIIEIRADFRAKAGKKRKLAPGKKAKKTEITTPRAAKRVIRLTDAVTVAELAKRMSVKANELIGKLMGMGMMVTINQPLDIDTATLVASEFGYEIENVAVAPEDLLLADEKDLAPELPGDQVPRAPVVTVMGHVDHGKTSLLDAIRKTQVAANEAGGITQHVGAYSVKTETGQTITFIDTPGHEAFTAMRARGAKVTDVVVLVVAGDDGVMPQTKEAVNHARSANVPILVAVNKMDKPGADPEKIKKALTEFALVPEEWGGETIYIPCSAKTGQGVPQLLEMLALQTDVLELRANPKKRAKGTVVEAKLDKRRGPVLTVLVQDGTLREGDVLVAGSETGRVRAMQDYKGTRIREAGPSSPVEVMGLSGVAQAGDRAIVVSDEKTAKQIAELRQKSARDQETVRTSKISLDDLYQKIEQGEVKELKVVIKADTTGSVEVLTDTLPKLSTPKVTVRVIHGAVGGVSENDVMLAAASKGVIVGFHVRPEPSAAQLAERHGVQIKLYDVIYHLTEEITKAMTGLLAPQKVEKRLGAADVKQIFNIQKVGTVAGCQVAEGKILRSASIRVIRDSVPVHTGRLASLRRFKDDVREVAAGLECGMTIENFNDVKPGDVIEAFQVEEVAPSLE